jgi:hypothetical protein
MARLLACINELDEGESKKEFTLTDVAMIAGSIARELIEAKALLDSLN